MPRALLRSDEFLYGVYTLESGTSRQASGLGLEELRAVAAFAADLRGTAFARHLGKVRGELRSCDD